MAARADQRRPCQLSSPAIFLGSIVAFVPLVFWFVRRCYHGRMTRVDAWDCGFPLQTARMQDSAEGFGQPIRRIFSPFFKRTREHPSPFDAQPRYFSRVEDPFWYWLYLPIAKIVEHGTRLHRLSCNKDASRSTCCTASLRYSPCW